MEQNHMSTPPLQPPSPHLSDLSSSSNDLKQQNNALPVLHPEYRHSLTGESAADLLDRLDRPLKLPSYPPPSYAQTSDPAGFRFPGTPKTELPPIQSLTAQHDKAKNNANNNTLPSFSALTASSAPLYSSSQPQQPAPAYSPPDSQPVNHWPSLNPFTAYYNPSHVQNGEPPMRMDVDAISNSGTSAASPDRFLDGRSSSVSLDDPDVRMAAEALGDLRADFVSSPRNKSTPLPPSPRSQSSGAQPEPLLSLLTTSHPLVATTIESATSAYISSKNYSPVFRSGAECVEGYVRPIAGAVGSVSRATGVEGGVRWFLGGGRRQKSQNSDIESGATSNKRRKVDNGSNGINDKVFEPGSGIQTPRASLDGTRRSSFASTIDTLPAYDDNRSPPYAENSAPPEERHRNGPSRVTMTTSGLGVAMTEESLRSLKYCLSWLKWANGHIGSVVTSLKTTMDKYERAQSEADGEDHPMQGTTSSSEEAADRNQLAAKITMYKSDVLKTLQDVINTVSRYAGGALPENARELVRHHLTSLPQRFRVANALGSQLQSSGARSDEEEGREKETRESAQRVLVLAKEGLDMMAQVSGVLDGTIVSAEEWCERLGQRKRDQRQELAAGSQQQQYTSSPAPPAFGDVKMG
ncbi:hypothetical protein DL770_007221 [Monosporascus sp. CRB-9-2]|nr:hypothetical protein DL770_007221 [Monosporascus sp. CRB-9-2]